MKHPQVVLQKDKFTSETQSPPYCTFCKSVILDECIIIGWIRACSKCFASRMVCRTLPSTVGKYLAKQALDKLR